MEENEFKPKVEKISLKEIRAEENKQKDAEFKKLYDEMIKSYKALSPEEKEMVFKK